MSDLQAKIIKEGTDVQKTYDEFAEWCEDRSKEIGFAIKDGKAEVEELKAAIAKEASTIDEMGAKIEETAAAISVDEKDQSAAKELRNKEAADFKAEEADLMDTIGVLERAVGILEKEMGSASLMQLKSANSVAEALKVMVQAEAFSAKDSRKLTALVQNYANDGDSSMGAPDPAAYENKSGGIVDTMQGLLEQAKEQLDAARSKEVESLNSFETLDLTLEDEISHAKKELEEAKSALAEAEAAKAAAEGDLGIASKTLAADMAALAALHSDCMEKAQDFEEETKSRAGELEALATAKKSITESTGGAAEQAYGLDQEDSAPSLLQLGRRSRLRSSADLAGLESLRFVRDLARKQKSPALAQLAVRMESVMRYGAGEGDDPFAKVKDLIKGLIDKLLKEAEAEAAEKAYCDKEMSETEAKKEDKEDEVAKLTAAIDKMTARSGQLKTEVAKLENELGVLLKSQAEMDKIRQDEHAAYVANKAEMEQGLQGVKMALKVLKDYYGGEADHGAASGAGAGIIGLIEVIESDFTKNLEDIESVEEAAAREYDDQTKENEILKVTMEQDAKFKTKEFKGLEESLAEATSDRQATQAELDAVLDYYSKIKARCIAKPMSFEERVKRREAEIAGLKEALEILSGTSVLQTESQVSLLQRDRRLRRI